MHTTRLIPRHSRAGGNPEGTGRENHDNHYPIMAIMLQNLPLRLRKGARGMPTRHSRAGGNPEGCTGGATSWQSWFKASPFACVRGLGGCTSPPSQLQVGPLAVVVSADGYDAEEVCATSLTDWHSCD